MTAKIWKVTPTIDILNQMSQGCIHDALGIRFTQIGDDSLEAVMPVDARTKNPVGILHGGASVVLAESLGSVAAMLVAGPDYKAVGIEINASHVKSAESGEVTGRAKPIRIGKLLQVWEIQIRNGPKPTDDLVCHCRLTVMTKLKQSK